MSPRVVVAGAFDDLRSPAVRLLEEASRLGELSVALWADDVVCARTGRPPKFPVEERRYLVESIRFVRAVHVLEAAAGPRDVPTAGGSRAAAWVVAESEATADQRRACAEAGVRLEVVPASLLSSIPDAAYPALTPRSPGGSRVIVTGCYDWLHSGHVRFFEEVSALGELYVALGHDENVRELKGEGHPLFPQTERRYMVQSVRFVTRALVSTGWGWLDAEPEIDQIQPDIYAVNRDGDKPEKRAFCEARGIRYVVLERTPRPGLSRRSSTDLRGY